MFPAPIGWYLISHVLKRPLILTVYIFISTFGIYYLKLYNVQLKNTVLSVFIVAGEVIGWKKLEKVRMFEKRNNSKSYILRLKYLHRHWSQHPPPPHTKYLHALWQVVSTLVTKR